MLRKSLALGLIISSASLFTNANCEIYRGKDNKAGALEVFGNSVAIGTAIGIADGVLAVKIAELLHKQFGPSLFVELPTIVSFPIRNLMIKAASQIAASLGIAHDTVAVHVTSFFMSWPAMYASLKKSETLKSY